MEDYEKVLCDKCGCPEFEYDSYYNECSCEKCGWQIKDANKILVIKKAKEKKAKLQPNKSIEKKPASTESVLRQPEKSEVNFERFTGSGVCDVCNKGVGPGDAYLVANDIFYASTKYRERIAQSGMLFGQSVDDFIAVTRSMDQTTHSAVCRDCIYLFKS